MRIGVVSDSHGNTADLKRAVLEMDHPDMIFHCGDYVNDGLDIQKWINVPVYTLRGNMDYRMPDAIGEDIVEIFIEGKKILACHGHQFNVKAGLNRIFYEAKSRNIDLVLYGHTHCAFCDEWDGIFFMNPGALTQGYSSGGKSYGLIDINKNISGKIIRLDNK